MDITKMKLIVLFVFPSLIWTATGCCGDLPPRSEVSFLDNGKIRLGVDLNRGGAIVYLARNGRKNMINNHDLGRQIQLSFFSGPVPFHTGSQRPADHWKHIGWNPIQAGDDFGNESRVLIHRNDGESIYLKCQPLQWPLNNVAGECSFESWLELDEVTVKGRAHLKSFRKDETQYAARLQELPAVYGNAPFHQVVSYTGNAPFSGEASSRILKPKGKHPWAFWLGTEGWSALLDKDGFGIGLITPDRIHFTGGFAGQPGQNLTMAISTGYLASQRREILDHNISYQFEYEIMAGNENEIRKRALLHRPKTPPVWKFTKTRAGWHYRNAKDTGWPVNDHLHILLSGNDPQLISPHFFLDTKTVFRIVIDAAYKTRQTNGTIFWQNFGQDRFGEDKMLPFPVIGDGSFHRYQINLKSSPSFHGQLIRLRIDPIPRGEKGDWMKVREVRIE